MRLFPAIDIRGGRCVRLEKGLLERETVYGDPAEMAVRWESLGAARLHVVDLDGAFAGEARNEAAVRAVAAAGLPVQLGGGVRTLAAIEQRLGWGVSRVILGTAALDAAFAKEAQCEFAGKLVAGIDAKGGFVAAKGWADVTQTPAVELGKRLFDLGYTHAVYTDIARDGMLTGPNLEASVRMQKETGLAVIASGGMSTLADIAAVKEAGLFGAILGKALYDGRIDLAEALKMEEE